jgi:hypothetical protein
MVPIQGEPLFPPMWPMMKGDGRGNEALNGGEIVSDR